MERDLHNKEELVIQMQAGSEDAFTTLYRHYSVPLYLNILKIVKDELSAEEILQELFTRVWQNRANNLMVDHFEGYMYRIAQNLVYDFFRKLKRDKQLMEKFKALVSDEFNDVEDKLQFQQTSILIHQAIQHLPPQQKKVYELIKVEGHTYKQTAEMLNLSAHTVKEYLANANKSVKSYLMNHGDKGIIFSCLMVFEILYF